MSYLNPTQVITWPAIRNTDADWEVGDAVYFRDLNADAVTVQLPEEKPFRAYPVYRGVVTFVNHTARWCTVQYGRHARTTAYFSQLLRTEDSAHKTVIVDSNLPQKTVDVITNAATSMGVWVCPMDLNSLDSFALDDAIESVYGAVVKTGEHKEYTYALGLAAAGFAHTYPEASVFDLNSLVNGEITEASVKQTLEIMEPLLETKMSALYIRAHSRT